MGVSNSSPEKNPEEDFVKAYQDKLNALDGSAYSLFNAIDVMDATAETLVKELQMNFEDKCPDHALTDVRLQQYGMLAGRLLTTSKRAVLHQKVLALGSLISLINFTKHAISANVKSVTMDFQKLYIEQYKDDQKKGESQTESKHMTGLITEIENQTDRIEMLKKQVKTLKEREETFLKEEILQRENIESLEKTAKEETEKHQQQIDAMKKENSNLHSQLKRASDYEKKYIDLTCTLNSLQEEHRRKTTENETDINDKKQRNEALSQEKIELEQRLKEYQQKIASLKSNNEKLEEMQRNSRYGEESLRKDYANLKEDKLNLTQEIEERTTELENLRKQNTKQVELLEEKNKKQEEKIKRLKVRIFELNQKMQGKEKEVVDLKVEIGDTIERHEETIEKLKQTINTLNKEKERKLEMFKKELRDTNERHAIDLQQVQNALAKEEIENQNYKKKMEVDVRQKAENLEKLQNKLDGLSMEKVRYESEISQLNTSKTELSESLQRSQEKAVKLETDLELKGREVNTLKLEDKKIRTEEKRQKQDYEAKLKALLDKNEILRTALTEKESKCESMQEIVDNEKIRYKNDIRGKDERIKALERDVQESVETAHKSSKSFKDQLHAFEQKLQENNQDLNDKRIDIRSLTKELEVERDEVKKCKEESASKDIELAEKIRTLNELKETMSEMEENQKQLLRRLAIAQEELDHITGRKILPVQLYCQKRTDLTKDVEEKLIDLLKNEFVSDRLELEFLKCSRVSDIQPDLPVLVICITASRIGTDVTNAIHGMLLSPNVAVAIFHHKDEHALPNQHSERVLTGKELKGIGGIFDMAYFSCKGIYPCEMNSSNVDSLVTFIKRVARSINL